MKNLIIIMLLILSTGCVSKLKVTVKSADREIVLKEAEKYVKDDVLRGITALDYFYYNWDEDDILNEMFLYIERVDTSELPASARKEYQRLFKEKFDSKIQNIKRLTKEANDLCIDGDNYNALAKINFAGKIIFEIHDILKTYEVTLIPNQKVDLNITKVTQQTSTIVNGTTRSKFPILGDPMVSFLTKKENDSIWKSCYNKTVSKNFFGNADIAFILRSNPPENELKTGDYNNNFTIKGVRLDATDSANALITGLTQTLNFVANTQGIPLNINQQSDTSTPIPSQNPLITELNNDKNVLESKKKKLLDYKKMLVEKIISEKIDDKTGTDLTNAIKRIETFWNTLKTELIK